MDDPRRVILPPNRFLVRASRNAAGSVTRFCLERHSSTGGGIVPLPFIGGLIHKSKTETVIGLTLRVIDVRTGEVVATATAESAVQQAITAAADKLLAAAPRLAHPDGAPGLAPFLRVP